MKTSIDNNTITLFFQGRVDSSNAPQIEEESMDALMLSGASSVIVDADDLEYISSAGLRVLLKLAKFDKDMKVVNVNRNVYDVFDMTGFTDMIKVERGLRKFSVEGCPIVGQGAVGTLYQYDEDTIVKVYRESTSYEDLVREREYSQLAFVHGVPSRISYDIVRVGDCYGMIYEMINSSSMGRLVSQNPERAEEMARKFAAVGAQIHNVDASDLNIATARDTYLRAADNLHPHYTDDEYRTICDMINAMPDGNCLIHGDYHPKNIMIQDGEPLLIDMGDICIGHPLYDWGTAYFVIWWLDAELAAQRSGIPRTHADRFWTTFLRGSFGDVSAEKLEQIKHTIRCAGLLRAAITYGISNSFPLDKIIARVTQVRESVLPYSAEIIEALRGAEALFADYIPKFGTKK